MTAKVYHTYWLTYPKTFLISSFSYAVWFVISILPYLIDVVIMFNSDYDISLFVPLFNILKSLGGLLQRIAPVYDWF